MRALNLLRADIPYRRNCFGDGLYAAGYAVTSRHFRPAPGDVLLIWNRYGEYHARAREFEAAGATVLVAENGWLGKDWCGGEWFSLSVGHHAGAGHWCDGGPWRWDGWGVPLAPWRTEGERVILGQRGIGEPGIAAPRNWAQVTQAKYGGRIRPHPGRYPAKPLEKDLANAGEIFTWNSGAALKALLMGIPVRCAFPRWIGASAAAPLDGPLNRSDEARLAMFRRLAWAMWTLDEIASGLPFRHR